MEVLKNTGVIFADFNSLKDIHKKVRSIVIRNSIRQIVQVWYIFSFPIINTYYLIIIIALLCLLKELSTNFFLFYTYFCSYFFYLQGQSDLKITQYILRANHSCTKLHEYCWLFWSLRFLDASLHMIRYIMFANACVNRQRIEAHIWRKLMFMLTTRGTCARGLSNSFIVSTL